MKRLRRHDGETQDGVADEVTPDRAAAEIAEHESPQEAAGPSGERLREREPGTVQAQDAVEGERGIPSVNRAASLQSRMSSLAAVGLMSVLGLGLLGWYYRQLLARPARAQESAQTAMKHRAQGEMPLPSLGRITPPTPVTSELNANGAFERIVGPAPNLPPFEDDDVVGASAGYAPAPVKSARQLALERRLSGPVFSGAGSGTQAQGSAAPAAEAAHLYTGSTAGSGPEPSGSPSRAADPPWMVASADSQDLALRLRPTVTPAVRAQVLPTQRLLLPKGAFIDCTLETGIDSSLPGMTTCVMATDSFSADGTVVLLERGTKLVGETRGQVQQGSTRVFVVWTQARTPTGVVVPLDSPGTDALGRAGLPGEVNRHFWERFGAAILISVIDGAVQAAVQSSTDGGTVIVNPSSTQTIMTEVLKSTINIAPTVVKHHGDRIQVLVARDLDFRSVYELRAATGP